MLGLNAMNFVTVCLTRVQPFCDIWCHRGPDIRATLNAENLFPFFPASFFDAFEGGSGPPIDWSIDGWIRSFGEKSFFFYL